MRAGSRKLQYIHCTKEIPSSWYRKRFPIHILFLLSSFFVFSFLDMVGYKSMKTSNICEIRFSPHFVAEMCIVTDFGLFGQVF